MANTEFENKEAIQIRKLNPGLYKQFIDDTDYLNCLLIVSIATCTASMFMLFTHEG